MKKIRMVFGITECIGRGLLFIGLTGAILFACMFDSEGEVFYMICRYFAGSFSLLLVGGFLMKWNKSRKRLYYSQRKCSLSEKETAGGAA